MGARRAWFIPIFLLMLSFAPSCYACDGKYEELGEAGRAAFKQGQFAKAEGFWLRALECAENNPADRKSLDDALSNLALLYCAVGRYERAHDFGERALRVRQKDAQKDSLALARSFSSLALIHLNLGEPRDADELSQKALRILGKTRAADNVDWGVALHNLGMAQEALGHHPEAEENIIKAMGLFEKELGKDHPSVAACLRNLGTMHFTQGASIEQAVAKLPPAVEVNKRRETSGESQVTLRPTTRNRECAAQAAGAYYAEAEEFTRRALDILSKSPRKDSASLGAAHNTLAAVTAAQRRYDVAIENYLAALDALRRAFGERHPDVVTNLQSLAAVLEHVGQAESAKCMLREAKQIQEELRRAR